MNIALLTREYPPHVYGGAGVHVENLARELSVLEGDANTINVLCFGDQKARAPGFSVEGVEAGYPFHFPDPRLNGLADVLLRDTIMMGMADGADIIHCHTWYTHLAGCFLKQRLRVPLVLTTHSLEPQRPWKEDQLGAGFAVSSWLEKTAFQNADGVIAVSAAMKRDVQALYNVPAEKVRVIYNGIDTNRYFPDGDPEVPRSFGIDPEKPYLLFLGRVTRQKGLDLLLKAVPYVRPGIQIVICAGAADTKEYEREALDLADQARRRTENEIIWIPEFVSQEQARSLYAAAFVFVCPSIYEPFGLINIEAMACATPVVASGVGGIPEIVDDGETGMLVPFEPVGKEDPAPRDPDRFARDLAAALNRLLENPSEAKKMGLRGRKRVEELFSWTGVARQTLDFYRELAGK